jgi:peptidoglycan/xylan/chitin deacetylase (PgdA/CDA1 family)
MSNLNLWCRRLVKTAIAASLGPVLRRQPPLVLGYHRVVDRFDVERRMTFSASLISRDMFERQLDWIGRHYDFVSIEDLPSRIERDDGRRPVAAVTFDDGYRDVYENAFPLLKRKGIPAAVFVVTDLVGTTRPQLADRLYLLNQHAIARWGDRPTRLFRRLSDADVPPSTLARVRAAPQDPVSITRAMLSTLPQSALLRLMEMLRSDVGLADITPRGWLPLTWEMLVEMRGAGMTIGSHTRTHTRMTQEEPGRQVEEAVTSKTALEQRLGTRVGHFAYPDGAFDATAVRVVADAGYDCAFTACRHSDPWYTRLTIPRLLLWEQSSLNAFGQLSSVLLRCQTRGLFTGAARCTALTHA